MLTILSTKTNILIMQKIKYEFVHDIINNLPFLVLVVDEDVKIKFANDQLLKLLGTTNDQIIGKRGGEAFDCKTHSQEAGGCGTGIFCQTGCVIRQCVTDALKQNQTIDGKEYLFNFNSGATMWLKSRTFPLETDSERVVVLCLEDITIDKEAETIFNRTLKLQGAIEAGITAVHEITQPLQVAYGYAETLVNHSNKNSSDYEYYEKIYSHLNKIAEIIRKIKNISDYDIKEYSKNINTIDLKKN